MTSKNDFSNKTVLVMLVLLLAVSVFSFSMFFSAVDQAEPVILGASSGKVSLNYREPPTRVLSEPVAMF